MWPSYGRGRRSHTSDGCTARGDWARSTHASPVDSDRSAPEPGAFSRYVQTRFAYYYLYLKGDDCNRGPGDLTRVLRTSHHVGGSYLKKYDDAGVIRG
jgi:hypothetical protein